MKLGNWSRNTDIDTTNSQPIRQGVRPLANHGRRSLVRQLLKHLRNQDLLEQLRKNLYMLDED
jgi:hypothetical protein